MALSEEQGGKLLLLARQTIAKQLGEGADSELLVKELQCDPELSEKRGTFVTLKISGGLRGCIGSLAANESIFEGVERNAANAAFHDARFSPLTRSELENLHLEVSILTEPQPLEYEDGNDLLDKLRPYIDGVIIRRGMQSATFLPQVWEQVPKPRDFLAHLCHKAMLSPNAWQAGELEVLTYQVQYFEE